MKAAIIQLSDIHLQTANDFIFEHKDEFFRSCKHIINECTKLIIIITGDIAYSGKKEEYDLAKYWLKQCEKLWKNEAKMLNSIEYVIVPGNHDCDFSQATDVRDLVISNVVKSDVLESADCASECLKVQDNFWEFYAQLTGSKPENKIAWLKEIRLMLNYKLTFYCYNSAILSKLNETPGELLIPENYFVSSCAQSPKDIAISVFHHNTGWITPNTHNNNKKKFEEHVFSTSNIVMCGHEHTEKQMIMSDLTDFNDLVYIESSAFQNQGTSSYNIYYLDTVDDSLVQSSYTYSGKCYIETKNMPIPLRKKQNGILLSPSWEKYLEKINIPLKHHCKEHLLLSDIFVYPDLEPLSKMENKCIQYIDSEDLLSNANQERIIVLEGECQSGKSSLLNTMYSSWIKKSVYPILLNGKQIKHYNIKQLLKNAYNNQYQKEGFAYDEYLQLDRDKKVLLIDNFDESELNTESKSKLLDTALANFEKIIITNGQQVSIKNILLQVDSENEITHYRILPLGYRKRNALIEKWIKLGQNVLTIDDEVILCQVKNTYDKISVLLGQQLIPSYPMFILSLLRGLNQFLKQFDVSQTSYAFCYNSLIISSLLKSGTDEEKINGVLKFLSEFSYFFYTENSKTKYFDKNCYRTFYDSYETEYKVPYPCEKLLDVLCKADLIHKTDEDSYSFAYKYVYYFLVAQKISQLINENKADGIVQELCNYLHKEQEANILIFLVYHNGTEKQMEDLLLTSMLPFENFEPITLSLNDPLFAGLNDIVDGIRTQVLLRNVDPKENREMNLRKSDETERALAKDDHHVSEEDFEENQYLRELNNTSKIIKILGQIVKNQNETLKKEQILCLIEESYKACFRSLAFFNNLVDNSEEEIIKYIIEHNKDKANFDSDHIKNKVQKLLHMLLYHNCLMSFSHLSRAIGTSNAPEFYDAVAQKINTPAAKIITFTIKTYYNKMHIRDLEEIVAEFKNNPVAMEIIKARVLNYVYNHYVDFSDCQKIGQLCNLKLVDNPVVARNKKRAQNNIL